MFTVIIVVCVVRSIGIPSFVLIGCCVSELHGHLCPYHNVLPEACFILQELHYIFLFCGRYGYLSAKFRFSTLSGY